MMPRGIGFDIDDTLTESKQPLTPSMAALLARLLENTKVAAISGGKFEIFTSQIFEQMPKDAKFENLYSVPNAGAALYRYEGGSWLPVYEEVIPEDEAKRVMEIVDRIAHESGTINYNEPSWGERVEYRKSSVTLSALGQTAPIDAKKAWDPSQEKRIKLRELIAAALPGYDVKRGGATSIDVTKAGINKAYGFRKWSEFISAPISEMLYVGDALFPGGNDEVVKETGVKTHQVANPEETAELIQEILSEA